MPEPGKFAPDDLRALLTTAESVALDGGGPGASSAADRFHATLREAERATPGGAAFHAQLDTVVKWVNVLATPDQHARFGGSERVHEHVRLQFQLARAAAEDYLRATGWRG